MKIIPKGKIDWMGIEMDHGQNALSKILIGDDHGSDKILMRYFTVLPNGYTPHHTHDFEHLIKVEKGEGIILDSEGNEHEVSEGMIAFIPANKKHQFRNYSYEPFEFLCVIPNVI